MSREIKRVLVVKTGGLREFVLALTAMRRIRATHRHARVTLLTTPPYESLAKSSRYFHEIETDGAPRGIGEWLALRNRIKAARYDRIYDLDSSRTTNLLFQLLRPFPPAWSGAAKGASLRHRNPRRERMHLLERLADQLKAAGIWDDAPTEPGSAPPPDLSFVVRRAQTAQTTWTLPRPVAILLPGGSDKRTGRRWPITKFSELAGRLHARGFDIVVLGGPEESALARIIQRTVPKARDLTGRSDLERIAVLGAKASLVVGNDGGRLHVLAAAGAPTIALFPGDADPTLNAPRGHVAVLQGPDLQAIGVDEVERAINNLLPA